MGKRREPRKEVQTPVRLFGTDSSGQVFSVKAVTVNVSQQGVELSGVDRQLNIDEIVGLTYGKNRVHFRVKWVGQAGTPRAGHVGLLNIAPEKPLWDFVLPSPVADAYKPGTVQQRRHARLKCRNSVELHTPEGASFWATISDLSIGGCHVEMAIPVRAGTTVKAGIWIGEIKIWAECEVVYSTPGFGIGVRFTSISEADLDRLRQFLTSITPFAKIPSF